MKMWIARDTDNHLYLYESKPSYMGNGHYGSLLGEMIGIDDNAFPEVTFGNSPKEVELKLIENEY